MRRWTPWVYVCVCVSEGVEPCSCRETAIYFFLWGFPCFHRQETCKAYRVRPLIVWCWHEHWDKTMETHAHTYTQLKTRQSSSGFDCFEWFPWSCYVLFRLHGNSFWFHRGGMLAGGPLVLMPEHVSGETSPSMKLSWAWTENHRLDAARNQLSEDCPHHGLVSVGEIAVMFKW